MKKKTMGAYPKYNPETAKLELNGVVVRICQGCRRTLPMSDYRFTKLECSDGTATGTKYGKTSDRKEGYYSMKCKDCEQKRRERGYKVAEAVRRYKKAALVANVDFVRLGMNFEIKIALRTKAREIDAGTDKIYVCKNGICIETRIIDKNMCHNTDKTIEGIHDSIVGAETKI